MAIIFRKPFLLLTIGIQAILASGMRPQAEDLISLLDSTVVDSTQVALRLEIADQISNADIRGALEYASDALQIAKQIDAPYLLASAKLSIGTFYDYLGVREEAIVQLMEAMELFIETGHKAEEIKALSLVGNAYFYLNQYESALKYSRRAYREAMELGDSTLIIGSINSIGAAYGNTGRMDSALILFRQGNEMARKRGNTDQEILTYFNMGDVNLYTGKVDEALGIFHDLEHNYDLENHGTKYLSSLYNSMTRAFILKNDLKWARRYSEKTREVLDTYTRLTESIQYYQQCYQIEKMAGNPSKALDHYLVYTQLKDSLNNASFRERLLNLEIFFDIQSKDLEIERLTLDNQIKDLNLRQRKIINYGTGGGLILVFIIGFLLVRSTRETRESNKILQKQKLDLEDANQKIQSQSEELKDKNQELESVIEELKATQQHLVQTEKMASLGTLTAGIAHEINNPLNFISGGIEIIRETDRSEGIPENERQIRRDKALQMARDGLDRTSNIVKALMTFSHKGTSKKVESDLHEIIDNTLLFLHSKIDGKVNITKDYRLESRVMVYPDKMHQVIMNILDNAIHATQDMDSGQGEIHIATFLEQDVVQLEICNNGPPISELIIGQLFDPFFTTKDPGEGTGLGLSISYSLVADHGGRITAENRKKCVAFIIEIPIKN